MEWTKHDKMMRTRVLGKLSDDEALWWEGVLERAVEAKRAEIQEEIEDWQRRNAGRVIGRAPVQQRVVVQRAKDTRGIIDKGFDFIFGED